MAHNKEEILQKSIEWYSGDFSFSDCKKKLNSHDTNELKRIAKKYKESNQIPQELFNSSLYHTITQLKKNYIDNYPGLIIISELQDDTNIEICTILSLCFGDLVPQHSQKNTLIREVKDRGINMKEGGRYSDTSQGGSFHNDGSPYPLPLPDYNLLFCINQAPIGGELLILTIESIYKFLLENHPNILNILFGKFHFDRRSDIGPNGEVTAEKPIFYFENGNICMTYLRDYINAGHLHSGVQPLDIEQIEALDTLDSILNNKKFIISGKLQPGEMIIINNKRTLHARTAFKDNPAIPRLMLRVWMNSRI